MLPIPDNPDPDLVRRTRQGDRDAFLELVRRHAIAVRAVVEARIPGSDKVDAETIGAFERIHRTLFVVRELTWFHLFAVRTAQAHLDAKRYPADDPGQHAPAWLRRLTLSQRESLFFAERAQHRVPFPAIEYLGISRQAYEARYERGCLAREAAPESARVLPPGPPEGAGDDIAQRVDEALGPAPARKAAVTRLPRLPLPLAFGLAVAVAAAASALLFRPPERTLAQQTVLTSGTHSFAGTEIALAEGGRLRVAPDGRSVELLGGSLVVRAAKRPALTVRLGERTVHLGAGLFRFAVTDRELSVVAEEGVGEITTPDGSVLSVGPSGELRWAR